MATAIEWSWVLPREDSDFAPLKQHLAMVSSARLITSSKFAKSTTKLFEHNVEAQKRRSKFEQSFCTSRFLRRTSSQEYYFVSNKK